ncbi:hypothetical protein GE21DRAFT_3606 [Neurospora crassa]|uniref:Uncharacterized protein n=1 Tax=Neurospora crassa (strain ATCC 24698 / 74-OR23-1A / CBS 708.71 / DSM 1257 / FGSC 987) TaxID=367110 RepID=Q1K8V0_NEUCR|nr:hypothetical protein NCU08732 [Neurospora crassa OR74A]EAA34357.2 hypothetical protein NCU08732 [Neurospora crassa OR74A]KHE82885.1 hypothetical protein GE21DRAFT_3606 [Neurospora crassa]|eukprot:XP_963593.2 hypothetical protein NCU08732 [Neurospora crassa OR74A]
MSAMDIVSTVTILINLGMEIKSRLDSLNQAAEELQLLTTNLSFLLNVFKDPVNEDIIQGQCALDIELAGASIATKTESGGKKFFKRIWAFNKIPDLLADIQRKADQLQRAYSAVSIVFLQHIKVQQGRTSGKETVESSTVFKACYGGQYIITAGVGSNAIVFSTRPVKDSFSKMLRDDDNPSSSIIPEFECTLLGPSTAFSHPPKVGEKVQVEYDGLWYDSRVTVVDGDEIEFDNPGSDDEYGSDGFFFPEEQLTELGKGMRRLWRPWRRNMQRYDVRPYRCFHIGDTVEAPVMYPDFRYHYHVTDNSELYLPARIVDVQSDQYVIEFSPALSVHSWWPGRIPKGEQIDLVPGSGIKVENPFDFNRVTVGMDRVRPFSPGPRPVLGIQSAKPAGWSSFQGVRLCNLEDLLERSLWDNL